MDFSRQRTKIVGTKAGPTGRGRGCCDNRSGEGLSWQGTEVACSKARCTTRTRDRCWCRSSENWNGEGLTGQTIQIFTNLQGRRGHREEKDKGDGSFHCCILFFSIPPVFAYLSQFVSRLWRRNTFSYRTYRHSSTLVTSSCRNSKLHWDDTFRQFSTITRSRKLLCFVGFF